MSRQSAEFLKHKGKIAQNPKASCNCRESAIAGALATNEVLKQKKKMQELAEALLNKTLNIDGEDVSVGEALMLRLVDVALSENDANKIKSAIECLRDTSGQKPVEKTEQQGSLTIEVVKYADTDSE